MLNGHDMDMDMDLDMGTDRDIDVDTNTDMDTDIDIYMDKDKDEDNGVEIDTDIQRFGCCILIKTLIPNLENSTNGKRKTKVCFLGRQKINGNRRLLFQQRARQSFLDC
jgi:hypothetical protein